MGGMPRAAPTCGTARHTPAHAASLPLDKLVQATDAGSPAILEKIEA